jgi:hypothetical protein
MPIIHDFRSTTIFKAFILNALASSVTIVIALLVKNTLDRRHGNIDDVPKMNISKIAITFFAAICTTLVAYGIMWIIFGYGQGMIAESGLKMK